jgi:hypothetical protein
VNAALTETTIRYLFATSWLPCDPEQQVVRVPGGSTTGLDTGGNLLHIAMWNLRRQGLMEFEQVRDVEVERVTVLGGSHSPASGPSRKVRSCPASRARCSRRPGAWNAAMGGSPRRSTG